MDPIEKGDRVWIVDPGEADYGSFGTVEVGEYPGPHTRRLMVDVHVDGHAEHDTQGFYVEQLEVLADSPVFLRSVAS